MIPLRSIAADRFAALRAYLADAGFDALGIASMLDIPVQHDIARLRGALGQHEEIASPIMLLAQLFLGGRALERPTLERHLPVDILDIMADAGLIAEADAGAWHAPALLCPIHQLYLASDMPATSLAPDAVFPALNDSTHAFLAMLPDSPCEALLDLGTGSGVAALAGAATATRVWATDIVPRAVRFATFNAELNGISNLTIAAGDLYQPVADLDFDRICAHPPFRPAPQREHAYRDGGEDGEEITRGILRGLPQRLRPGGTFHCTCLLTERGGLDLAQRIRGMLGEQESAFDIAIIARQVFDPDDFVHRQRRRGLASDTEADALQAAFDRLEIERLVYGSFLLHRHVEVGQAITVRRSAGADVTWRDAQWLLAWQRQRLHPDFTTRLLDSTPAVPATTRLHMSFAHEQGGWATTTIRLEATTPFPTELRCPPWLPHLLARCDGRTDVASLLEAARADDLGGEDIAQPQFLELVAGLISAGILTLPDLMATPREAADPPT